ncbi:hypothetical protein PENANT_c004G08936 [Penicillium antarcticum]|uniref:Uncharacterized protein n=1 Tax=Penicillium antarcticum TaxID=416450 RepID=A0A1V6QGR7_9EURO|nr:hypothetical protein PENANT_c004G08936 [Penicillium antarcticum]
MQSSDPWKKSADGRRLSNDRLDRLVLVYGAFFFPCVRRPYHRYKIRRQRNRRIREAEAAYKIRNGPRTKAKWFRRLVPKSRVDHNDAQEDIYVPVSSDIDGLEAGQYEKSDVSRVLSGTKPCPLDPSEDDLFGVAVVAEFTPVRARCVDIYSMTPASTHLDVYCNDWPGSSPNTSHVSIIRTPSTPPSSISSKQNVRPNTSYTASTMVGYLEVPPKTYTAEKRQEIKPLANVSGHDETASRSNPRSATPTVIKQQDKPNHSRFYRSKDKYLQATKIPISTTTSAILPANKPFGTPRLSSPSHVECKHCGITIPMADRSTQTEKSPRLSSPILFPTATNIIAMKGQLPSHAPFLNDRHDQIISTVPVNDENLEDVVPPPLKIHQAGYDPKSFRARVKKKTGSSSLDDIKSSTRSPQVPCTASSIRKLRGVSNPRDVLDKMRNGALPDRPSIPDFKKQLTRKPVPPPPLSTSATRTNPPQQTNRPVSNRGDRTEHHPRGQVPQIYAPEWSDNTRRSEETTFPANSTRALWRNMPDASARNLSLNRRQAPQQTLQQRIAIAKSENTAQSITHLTGPQTHVVQNSPERVVPLRLAPGVPESPLVNDIHPENLVWALEPHYHTQWRRREARPINDFEQAPTCD